MTIDPVTSTNQEAVPVTRVRGVKPRKTGLLSEIHWQRDRPQNQTFSYALGDRILPDLTVIGHLCAGRWSEIYQVWSAEGWCSLTCKVLAARAVGDRTARAALRREHRILRKLHHPNVVRVFGGGRTRGDPISCSNIWKVLPSWISWTRCRGGAWLSQTP